MLMKNFGYTILFSNGVANSGINFKGENEKELIEKLLKQHEETIVSITVVEM